MQHDEAITRTPEFIQSPAPEPAATRQELLSGLCARQPHVAPKYLYDALGSRLFEAITELPEYYPTRTEAAIFDAHAADIAEAAGIGSSLIDLGAGNCEKAARLFGVLRPACYVAVDISVEFLRNALSSLQRQFPTLPMAGVGLDFSHSLALPQRLLGSRPVFFYPGSSIGNFTPAEALAFLRQVRALAGRDGGLLIGIDRVKPRAILEPAYADALGVTAAFNLNLLLNLNRLLGTDFVLSDWAHLGLWNDAQSRVEKHLQARRDVTVHWDGGERRYAKGERIHTENSYKYRRADFDALLHDAGFGRTVHWNDPRDWFSVVYAWA
jgi:dimethylhistidine N-methyltransferase